ncbi:mitogen-activated protein kinase [Aureococcus anophagefferens]|nr:mitogen-activated protein kinase [Aureococcus anophagefferens]
MASRKSLITHHDERDRTIEGYLKKKTSMFAWKRHFVVVDERGTLSYFANELALHPSGAIKLERGVSVGADATKEHCFVLRDGARAFRFQADHAGPGALGPRRLSVARRRIGRCFSNLLDAKRTLRELRLLHSCVHPNLLDVWDCYRGAGDGGDFDDVYVVMELLATDLHQVIYARQELSTKHVTYFMYQMLSGLRHLHAAGVLHRDLKPGNVLLNESCELKICDFGLARSLDVDDPTS